MSWKDPSQTKNQSSKGAAIFKALFQLIEVGFPSVIIVKLTHGTSVVNIVPLQFPTLHIIRSFFNELVGFWGDGVESLTYWRKGFGT